MNQLETVLKEYREGTREFPTYAELIAIASTPSAPLVAVSEAAIMKLIDAQYLNGSIRLTWENNNGERVLTNVCKSFADGILAAAGMPQAGQQRLSAVQIDSIRNTVMIQLGKENAGVIGGPDVEDMLFPKRFAEAIMTALGSPVPACGVCGDTGKWHMGFTGLFGGSVPVYETCKCAAALSTSGEAKAVATFTGLSGYDGVIKWDKPYNDTVPIPINVGDKLYAAPVAQALPVGVEKDALAALLRARDFIRNGVEFGFIRMPDADTPDPAHTALPQIEAAITAMQGSEP